MIVSVVETLKCNLGSLKSLKMAPVNRSDTTYRHPARYRMPSFR